MDGGLTRMGVIRNARSRLNLQGTTPAPTGALHAEPETPEALPGVLARFREAGVDLLVVDGGDGTVREILTALPSAWGESAPLLAVLPSGKTNVIAADVGVRGPRRTALNRLAAAWASGRLRRRRRRPLRVSRGGDVPPLRGFVWGAAAYAWATELALATSMRRGRGGAALAATLARAALHTLAGEDRTGWRNGEAAAVTVDGEPWPEGRRFLVMATTLERLMLGLWPFWSVGDAPLKLLDVAAPPARLPLALPFVLRGRSRPWMADAGYRSAGAGVVDLVLSAPFILDGEAFKPGSEGRVRLSAAPALTFVSP